MNCPDIYNIVLYRWMQENGGKLYAVRWGVLFVRICGSWQTGWQWKSTYRKKPSEWCDWCAKVCCIGPGGDLSFFKGKSECVYTKDLWVYSDRYESDRDWGVLERKKSGRNVKRKIFFGERRCWYHNLSVQCALPFAPCKNASHMQRLESGECDSDQWGGSEAGRFWHCENLPAWQVKGYCYDGNARLCSAGTVWVRTDGCENRYLCDGCAA